MTKEEFLKEFSEYNHMFDLVSEPSHSKSKLIEFQGRYPGVSSQDVYWLYKTQGFQEVSSYIPDIDDWTYYFDRFLRYGGNAERTFRI